METPHLYQRFLKGLPKRSIADEHALQFALEVLQRLCNLLMSMILCDFFASTKCFVEVVITCFYVQKRNEHGITVWIYNKR